ncbi:unnamed protein product [Lasius platythorax]|uniref:Cytochrome P450 n=1 Tax=Lasius platythorax TaxID=488582 RepID=A0AAV2NUY5_9HYME
MIDQFERSSGRSHQGPGANFGFRHRLGQVKRKELLLYSSLAYEMALREIFPQRDLSFAPIRMGSVVLDRGMLLRKLDRAIWKAP